MQFVNEEWAKNWQQEYRFLQQEITKGKALFVFAFFLFFLWLLRLEAPPLAQQIYASAGWGGLGGFLYDRKKPSHLPEQAGARARAVVCHALLLMGFNLALELAFFSVALSAGIPLTVPLQALVAQDPALAWPEAVHPNAHVLSPVVVAYALSVVPFTCVGLMTRLGRHKPRPSWMNAAVFVPYVVVFSGFAFLAGPTCVAIYRSPLAAVAGGLLLIAAFALLVALLGRQWEVPASAKPTEPTVAEA